MAIKLIPAADFSIQELTGLYNQTRVDYLVPMPMNADRLAEYVRDFSVDLSRSCVASDEDGQILGLNMLGVRGDRAWVTRLGVLTGARRNGVGSALMDWVLAHADSLNVRETVLEVIKNNTPAHNLFLAKGFQETGEYLVLRRAPRPTADDPLTARIDWLDSEAALELLRTCPNYLTWVNAHESMQSVFDLEALHIRLSDGGSGWLAFRNNKFTLRSTLSHLVMNVEAGNPAEVALQLLLQLHQRYPRYDTYAENIRKDELYLSAFHALGYFENFSRIEMRRAGRRT